jgi:aryl-alcohol dehydrogenase-like predicted oxidoreductase
MNKRKLGRTDLHVSELCLNTASYGFMDDADSFALLDTYYTCGGSFLQTVGTPLPHTATSERLELSSESTVGRWHEKRGLSRESLVLASRINFFRPAHGGSITFTNLIRESCERSLRRLRANHLDLLICDWADDLLPLDDVLEAVDMLIRAGLVRYAVAGGFPPWRVVDSLHRSRMRNHARFEALQSNYSLENRGCFGPEVLAMCREHRLGFLADSPLGRGFLLQRPTSVRELMNLDRDWKTERSASNVSDAVLQALADIADKRLASPSQIALAWVLSSPQVTSAVISGSNPRELRELSLAGKIILSPDEIATLADVPSRQQRTLELQPI